MRLSRASSRSFVNCVTGAGRNGTSLNDAVIEAIKCELGVTGTGHIYKDLDDLAGSWHEDELFDRAIIEQNIVDVDA